MKEATVSIAEGKKDFSRLIQSSQDNKEDIIVTKRGKPVAVIMPYEKYQKTKRMDGYKKIMEARVAFLNADIDAEELFEESKKQRERFR